MRKSVYILPFKEKNTRFKKRKQQRRDRKLFVFLAELEKTYRKNQTDRLEAYNWMINVLNYFSSESSDNEK